MSEHLKQTFLGRGEQVSLYNVLGYALSQSAPLLFERALLSSPLPRLQTVPPSSKTIVYLLTSLPFRMIPLS